MIRVAVSGNYAYAANANDGLRVFDVSNPANPIDLGHTNSGSYAEDLVLASNRVYLVDDSGFRIYDVSNPTNVVETGRANDGPAYGVAVSGSHAYSANYGNGGLRVFDVSNPANPFEASHIFSGVGAHGVAVSGNYAFLAHLSQGLKIYDVSNPTDPVDTGFLDTQSTFANDVTVANNLAYVAGETLRIYDMTNPTNTLFVGQSSTNYGGTGYDVTVSGNYAFLANYYGLRVFDISNPTTPVNVGQASVSPFGFTIGIAVQSNFVYVANGPAGLFIYQMMPQLRIEHTSTNAVLVSWPVPPANNIVLQHNSILGTTNWLDVTNSPVIVSNRNQVTFSLPTGSAFYRLKSP